jgi:hypothetical protein
MLDKARVHRRKRGPLPKREAIPLLDTSVATEFVHSIKKQWPGVREKLEPYVNKGKEKFGDAYASVAKILAERKEAFEDRLAEKKERERSQATKKSPKGTAH